MKQIIEEASRPLLLRCQIGVAPQMMNEVCSPYVRSSSSSLHEGLMSPGGEESLKEPMTPLYRNSVDIIHRQSQSCEELSISFSEGDVNSTPMYQYSPFLPTPVDDEQKRVRRFYRFVTPSQADSGAEGLSADTEVSDVIITLSCKIQRDVFVESLRVTFMLELCRLIGHYRSCFCRNWAYGMKNR